MDSDGSELSTASKISSVSMLSTQSERPRAARKQGYFLLSIFKKSFFLFLFSVQTRMHEHHHFHRNDEVQLNEEELRQMAMRTHDTITQPQTTKTDPSTQIPSPPMDKVTTNTTKVDPRNDGTLSDSVLSTQPELGKKRRPSMSSKALVILGLSKKTNSASNLGYGKSIKCQKKEMIDDFFFF